MAQPQNAGANELLRHQRLINNACTTPLSVVLGDDPHADFEPWLRALYQRVDTFAGGLAALQDEASAVALPAAPAMGDPPVLTNAQYLQQQLRALLRISIKPDSPAARLIEGYPHASGLVAGVHQAMHWLMLAYHVAPVVPTYGEELTALMSLKWPRSVSEASYVRHVSEASTLARKCGLYPEDDADASRRSRALWFHVISSPPAASAWKHPSELAFAHVGAAGLDRQGLGTVVQFRAFIDAMTKQSQMASSAAPKALSASLSADAELDAHDARPCSLNGMPKQNAVPLYPYLPMILLCVA